MNDAFFNSIVKKINIELPYIDTVTLSGFGEFSVDPNWKQKVAIGSQHFKTVHIVTNASLLTEEDLDFLLETVSDIRISLYGLDERTYRLIHNPPAQINFAQVKQNIEYFSKHKKLLRNGLSAKATAEQAVKKQCHFPRFCSPLFSPVSQNTRDWKHFC